MGGFCSAHWFDYHQSGIVAQGWYQQGLRLLDVRDPTDIKQSGYFTAGASQVWDAYWVPARNPDGTAKANREKTNIIYTADLVRGLDVFEVKDLPAAIAADAPGAPPTTTTDTGTTAPPPAPTGEASATAGGGPSAAAGSSPAAGGGGTPTPDPAPVSNGPATTKAAACGRPTSRFGRGTRLRRTGLRLRGAAAPGKGCKLRAVYVAIGRKTAKRCRFLRADGRFGPKVSCRRTSYIKAKGRARWRLDKRVRLPRGSYLVWSRAVNTAGRTERKAAQRNLIQRRIRR